jgi:hypothetical protein
MKGRDGDGWMDDHRAGIPCRRLDNDRRSPSGAQDLAVETGQGPVYTRMFQFRACCSAYLRASDRLLSIILMKVVTLMLAGANLALKIKDDCQVLKKAAITPSLPGRAKTRPFPGFVLGSEASSTYPLSSLFLIRQCLCRAQ